MYTFFKWISVLDRMQWGCTTSAQRLTVDTDGQSKGDEDKHFIFYTCFIQRFIGQFHF